MIRILVVVCLVIVAFSVLLVADQYILTDEISVIAPKIDGRFWQATVEADEIDWELHWYQDKINRQIREVEAIVKELGESSKEPR